jgi:hypothetical protein
MGYTRQTRDLWYTQAHAHAPLGLNAVRDSVKEVANLDGVEIVHLRVERLARHAIEVVISHRDYGKSLNETLIVTKFAIHNPSYTHHSWERNLDWMKHWQAKMAPHLRGAEINVTEGEYTRILDEIKKVTTYDGLAIGDIWVHKNFPGDVLPQGPFSNPPHATLLTPGELSFGYLTRAGEIAVHKYMDLKGIKRAAV